MHASAMAARSFRQGQLPVYPESPRYHLRAGVGLSAAHGKGIFARGDDGIAGLGDHAEVAWREGLTSTMNTGRDQMDPIVPQPIVMTLAFPSAPRVTSSNPSSRIRWIV